MTQPEPQDRPVVLVADDDEMQRFLFRETLESAGFAVLEAADGAAALELVERHRPDLLLLDVVMAPMDGFSACLELRRKPDAAHTPVLMVTGLDDLDSIERAYEVGATDFLPKPVNWALLGHRVRYLHRANCAFEELRISRERLAEAQRIARLGNWEWHPASDRFDCSDEVRRIFGLPAEMLRPALADLLLRVHPEDAGRVRWSLEHVAASGRPFDLDLRIVLPDGGERILAARMQQEQPSGPQELRLKGTFQDVTERRRAEARLHHLAHHDALTDLPNRALFQDRLEHALARARRDGSMVAVLCLDVDRFKEVNDTLGHAAGDRLLQTVSERLQAAVRGSDTVARLGGDEFAIIQVGIDDPEGTLILARRLEAALARPFDLDGHEVAVGTSMGIAMFPTHGDNPGQLLMNADMAMYSAKGEARGTCRMFEPGMDATLRARKEMEQDLRRGLANGWFELHYQPQLTVGDGRVVGAEALLRLRHPDKGLLLPAAFIAIAEETGLILPIGEWVLRTACAQAAEWQRDGMPPVRIAVNLSGVQLCQPDFVATVDAALRAAGLAPDLLELEITESTLMRDTAAALRTLQELRGIGVRIAMDDFGTGYSSLSYLQLFPFDRIKIDRSFVRELCDNPEAAAIVRAIVGLGHSLDMQTTAEGVETGAQLGYLKSEDCDEVQGFYFGEAVPAAGFRELLETLAAAPAAAG